MTEETVPDALQPFVRNSILTWNLSLTWHGDEAEVHGVEMGYAKRLVETQNAYVFRIPSRKYWRGMLMSRGTSKVEYWLCQKLSNGKVKLLLSLEPGEKWRQALAYLTERASRVPA